MLNVKSTMLDSLLSLLAPHYCCHCGAIGAVLCDNCKYDIVCEDFEMCLACGENSQSSGICRRCCPAYDRAWCVGKRSGVLQRVIGDFKFQNRYDAHRPLGELLLARLPDLPPQTVIVPVPTIRPHIRQRGYDHTLVLARYVAKKRTLTVASPLTRTTLTRQRGADKATRLAQAKAAFVVSHSLQSDVPYLLLDDVVTTGATMEYAARALREAGATVVWALAVARQPLD